MDQQMRYSSSCHLVILSSCHLVILSSCHPVIFVITPATVMSLHNCRVVLVRPQIADNIGATARVMRNMGLKDLVLVAPEASAADHQARRLSTHGEAILDSARCVTDLGEAWPTV
jgi:hypothetical protein